MDMTTAVKVRERRLGAGKLAAAAMLSALSFLLAYMEIPVPLSPAFARFDLSDFPALAGAFLLGPMAGLAIEFIKNILQMFSTSTAGIGELANFLIGAGYVCSAGAVFKLYKGKHPAWTACVISSFIMGIVAAAANYFLLLPTFEQFMPMEQLISSFGEFIPFINTKLDVVLYNAFPFNVLKGLVIGAVTVQILKRAPQMRKETV